MLRNVTLFLHKGAIRYYATAALPSKAKKIIRSPLITCKNTGLNLFPDQLANPEKKLGEIPLASKGWMHRKSKGDFFYIHPTVKNEAEYHSLSNTETLTECKVDPIFIKNLKEHLEIDRLTSTQTNAIPIVIDMNHVLIAAETGCGKTLAYLLPIVQQVLQKKQSSDNRKMNTPLALIITPGRELASQIGTVAEKLCSGTGINVKTILGGNTKQMIMNPDFDDMDILVASMGAVSKLVTTGIYRMNKVRHVVLDEADTLLDDSFSNKLCHFLKRFPFYKNHLEDLSDKIVGTQLILASATMPTNITELLKEIIDTETIHEVVSPNLHRLMPNIKHKFLRMNKSDRPGHLLTTVKAELRKNYPIIVFANKSAASDYVSIFLNDNGVNCVNLNGDMLMKIRIGRFEKFQNGEVDVLSTTDVGSRGLDTTRAKHVINFDFPLHVSDYIHRSGRIGRVGSLHNCTVTNFISSLREIEIVQQIEHAARTGNILPNVNANITNLIFKRVLNDIKQEERKTMFQ